DLETPAERCARGDESEVARKKQQRLVGRSDDCQRARSLNVNDGRCHNWPSGPKARIAKAIARQSGGRGRGSRLHRTGQYHLSARLGAVNNSVVGPRVGASRTAVGSMPKALRRQDVTEAGTVK